MNRLFCALGLSTLFGMIALGCSGDDGSSDGASSSGSSGVSSSSSGESSSGGGSSSGGSSGGTASSSGTVEGDDEVELTFSGAFEAVINAKGRVCGGTAEGASFVVRSEEFGVTPLFELATVLLGPEDWAEPPTVLNVKEGERISYAWGGRVGTVVVAEDGHRVDYDAELRPLTGGDNVKVTGAVVCAR